MSEISKEINRWTVVLPQAYKNKVEDFASKHRITQGEVLEVLLDQINVEVIGSHFEAKRENKVAQRGKMSETKKVLMEKLKDMSPDEIADLLQKLK